MQASQSEPTKVQPTTALELVEEGERVLADSPADSVALARKATEAAQHEGDRLAYARAHLLYGLALRRMGDLVSAQAVLADAELLLQEIGETFYLARLWQAQAAIYNAAGKLDESIDCLVRALPLATKHHDVWTLQRILTTWAVASMRKGDFRSAIERLREAEHSLDEHPDDGLRTVVLNALGSIYQRTRNYEISLQYFRQSLDISRRLRAAGRKESRNYASSLICISDTLITLGRSAEAAPYLDEAYDIARERELLDVQASVLKAYGDRAMSEQHFGVAADHYRDACDLLEATGNGMIMITVLNQLGDALIRAGELDQAEETLLRAVKLEVNVASPEHEFETHRSLATVYEMRKDYPRATEHYKLALSSQERLFSESNQRVLRQSEGEDIRPLR